MYSSLPSGEIKIARLTLGCARPCRANGTTSALRQLAALDDGTPAMSATDKARAERRNQERVGTRSGPTHSPACHHQFDGGSLRPLLHPRQNVGLRARRARQNRSRAVSGDGETRLRWATFGGMGLNLHVQPRQLQGCRATKPVPGEGIGLVGLARLLVVHGEAAASVCRGCCYGGEPRSTSGGLRLPRKHAPRLAGVP